MRDAYGWHHMMRPVEPAGHGPPVPVPFRDWLALHGKGKGYFTQNPRSPDTFCETALNEWSGLRDFQTRGCPGDPFAMPEFVEPAEP